MNSLLVQKVFKSYRTQGRKVLDVLKGVDLEVASGEKVAIIGRSGAGKSTLLHILGDLLKPDSGSVTRPANFGFVFQSYHLMPDLNVLENVLLPVLSARTRRDLRASSSLRDCRKRAVELLEKTGLGARMHHLPSELSGGERQRVAIARSLVTNPSLVLADEPTGNLDALTGAGVLEMLSALSGNDTSLVLVTHSPEAANICNRVLVLEDGVLKERR